MARPTLDEIFAEPDEFGLLDVKPAPTGTRGGDRSLSALAEVTRFQERHAFRHLLSQGYHRADANPGGGLKWAAEPLRNTP